MPKCDICGGADPQDYVQHQDQDGNVIMTYCTCHEPLPPEVMAKLAKRRPIVAMAMATQPTIEEHTIEEKGLLARIIDRIRRR